MRSLRSILCLLTLLTAIPVAPARAAVPLEPIQPGAIIFTDIGQCTQNMIVRDREGTLYSTTAGHCVGQVGNTVRDGDDVPYGTIVWQVDGTIDFALIQIFPHRYDDVSPQMRVWGGPTGYTTSETTTIGDVVLQHGYGLIYGSNEVTRSRRGVLQWDTDYGFGFAGLALFGDSGGPALHMATGRAIGFVNGLGGPTSLVNGSTFEHLFVRAADEGFPGLEIVTAPYVPLI